MDSELLEKVVKQVESFLIDTEEARILSERDRDYKDHKQWTAQEIAAIEKRKQAPIVVNRIKPKIDGLLGLVSLRKTDPKAYPRTKKHEKSAADTTDALRFVSDNNDFNGSIKPAVAENLFVEGYGGAIVDVRQNGAGEIEVRIEEIPWDRIYFDPHSRKRDFSDARFKGVILWMSKEEAQEKFPDADIDLLVSSSNGIYETFEDRPRWVEKKERVRVALHFWIKDGVWWMCSFSQNMFLVDPQESPFLDEYGQPDCPIELVSAYIDRNNRRYGEVRGFIDQQDEINHRRSKALHLLSQRQTFGTKKAGIDTAAAKRELAKPDGHLELNDGELNKDFGILPTGDMAQGQFELYQDAKAELDSVSFNAQMAGERQQGDLSGVAIGKLQQAGATETNALFTALSGWVKRINRQVWARIKQFWTEEKWVRVTDNRDSLRWVGFNGELTAQQFLEETINDPSQSIVKRKQAAAVFQKLMAMQQSESLEEAALAEQTLNEVVGVKNPVAELDVDIIIDESFDTINVQQEQFQMLAQFGQGSDIDIIELIELSELRGKDELIEKIQKRRQEAAQSQDPANSPELAIKKAEIELKAKETEQRMALAQKETENNIMLKRMELKAEIEIEREKAAAKIEIEQINAAEKNKLNQENNKQKQAKERDSKAA